MPPRYQLVTPREARFAYHQQRISFLGTSSERVCCVWKFVSALLMVPSLLGVLWSAASPNANPPDDVLISEVPHIRQKPDFCGEACVAMALKRLGRNVDQDWVFDQSGLDPLLGRGCYTRELAKAIKAIGFDAGPVWHTITAANAEADLNAQFQILYRDLKRGVPSIVCMHYSDQPNTTEHFRLIVGYSQQDDEVIYHEPAVENGAYQRMDRRIFLKLWPLKYEPARWTLIRMPLVPSRLVEGSSSKRMTDADYAQHVMRLKEKLGQRVFTILIEKPFVVLGDEDEATVKRRSEETIAWAIERLKKDYFSSDPDHIIDVWLFKDKDSYEQHAWEFLEDRPTTPYGYYSAKHKALVMNIATGGGTLVHEIVHPFMAANFPACPSWFNEGLASLYEQCGDNNGHIHGYTNWRLTGLQEAIGKDRLPSFEELCGTTTREFYDDGKGTNYAQARYLCYYLQERGLLVKYYHAFRKNAVKVPTGYDTLQTLLGEQDMQAFQDRWEEYVLKLKRN